MNEREGFRSQKTLNLYYIVFNYKKSEDPRRFVLRRKALETFARAPFRRSTIVETEKL